MPGPDLPHPPHRWIEPRDQADLGGTRAVCGEEQRYESPRERVIEVVDQPRLRAGAKRRLAVGGVRKDVTHPRRRGVLGGVMKRLFERDMVAGVANEEP